MDEESFLDSSRPAGDPVGGGSHRRSRSGGDWVDNEGAMGRDHVRPNMGLGLGSGFGAADAQAGQGSSRKRVGIDARRSDSVNLDDEDDGLIRNGSATREAPFKGLETNDIHHVWNHGPKYGGGFHCQYCNMKNSGGGATRFKEHLGKIVGEVKECPNVPRNVHDIMRKAVLEMRKNKREKESRKLRFERELMDEMYQRNGVIHIDDDEDEEIRMALRESLRDRNVSRAVERRRGSGSGVRVSLGKQSITAYFDKQLSSNKVSMQPKISTAMDSSSRDAVGQAWAKFFHANDIAGRKADCPYFWAAMKITQNLGAAPIATGKEIDGKYLDKNYEESREWLKLFKQDWKNYGVTVMCDSWTGPTGMSLINFMVYCNTRMFFHKSIDASGQSQNSAEWWFQFGGEVPNLQKWALRIVSQCVSSSGCERNWTAFALVHTKQRNRLLYCKLQKSVSVRYNLKLRAEEDEDIVKLSYREKEIDPCAMMMDTVMHDESNPMMEWLNEDEEHIVLDGSDAATAVLEEIRRLNSRRKASHLGRKEISGKGKRVREDEEDEFISSEDDDEANGSMDIDDGDDGQEEDDDQDDESDGEGLPRQAEKNARSQVNDIEVTRDENLVNRRSGRQAKKVKDVNSLYY